MQIQIQRRLLGVYVIPCKSVPKLTKYTVSHKMLFSCSFEVFGKVQKVYFRKHTQEEGQRLGLVGWVMNTDRGTVIGQIQGEEEKFKQMQDWLQNVGSPQSKIERAEFKDVKQIDNLEFQDFELRR
eukprot:TRINITY_DN1251_c0_g1_i2.p2 TRINITY_DN1251_c0_g1~~TRINITY_DN1251_c0_g1_i2.p2  ORF type:complete len:126 (+),score=11.04 TRINITY_DN1251_c0_g1_i2:51-428(+)